MGRVENFSQSHFTDEEAEAQNGKGLAAVDG